MKSWIRSLLLILLSVTLFASGGKEFAGKMSKESPATAAIAIDNAYCMFSKEQLCELRKSPYIISEYELASWIENNWLATKDAPLYAWFECHGIKVKSSMTLFVVRGFQFKLYGKRFDIKKELKNPSWNKLPEPPLPLKDGV